MDTTQRTRRLLTCGILAGPLYLAVGLAQALTRPGFDLTRHDLSLLANGDLGWVQVANFFASGALVVAAALGMRRAGAPAWGARLVAAYGVGLVGAGLFAADPALGFPPGTPADARAVSWHGVLHLACGGLGFLALVAACLVVARRAARAGQPRWAAYSAATGVVFLAGFVGIASGSGGGWTLLGFWVGVVAAWAWLAAAAARLLPPAGGAERTADRRARRAARATSQGVLA